MVPKILQDKGEQKREKRKIEFDRARGNVMAVLLGKGKVEGVLRCRAVQVCQKGDRETMRSRHECEKSFIVEALL